MSKYKTTKTAIKSEYDKIASIGYCNAQFLLRFQEPFAYSERAEGWSCDYYDINDVLISTGYAPLDNKRTHCDYDTVKKYDDKSRIICNNYDLSYEQQKEQVNELLNTFINEII